MSISLCTSELKQTNIHPFFSQILPKEIVVVEDVASSVASLDTIKKSSDDDDSNNDANNDGTNENSDNAMTKVQDPRRPENCKTKRDRYSWRKWVGLWREVQEMNRKRYIALESQGEGSSYREDVLPAWTPTWKKRKGDLWELDLLSRDEELNRWEERESAKIDWGGRPPTVDYNYDENSSFWSNMSDPKKIYSSDESYDSGEEYNSDF